MKRSGKDEAQRTRILVVADLEYLRDGIQALLESDGYQVTPARAMQDAMEAALRQPPDLILVTLDLPTSDTVRVARSIRGNSGLASNRPILLFCIPTLSEGEVAPLGENTWATYPANFNQLRKILRRLLASSS